VLFGPFSPAWMTLPSAPLARWQRTRHEAGILERLSGEDTGF
jgi:hypothetical protein